jgi:hypothetical protein
MTIFFKKTHTLCFVVSLSFLLFQVSCGKKSSSSSTLADSAANSWTGIKQLGVPGQDVYSDYIAPIYVDASSKLYVSGYTSGNLAAGSGASVGSFDAFVRKYDSSGTVEWTSQFGVAGLNTEACGVMTDSSGNFYVQGDTTANLVSGSGASTGISDAYLIKFNSSGVKQWTQQLGVAGYGTYCGGVAVDDSGNAFISGLTSANLVSGSGASTGSYEAYVIKFNSSGEKQWTQQLGVAGYATYFGGVAVDGPGNVFISGTTFANLVSGSGASTGRRDAYLIKFNSSGVKQWTQQLGIAGYLAQGKGLGVDGTGNVFISGLTSANLVSGSGASTGSYDAYLIKFNSSGVEQWIQQLGVAGYLTQGRGLAVDGSGNAFISGQTSANLVSGSGPSTGSYDAYVIKFNSSGVKQWTQQLGVAGYSTYGSGLAVDIAGDIILGGTSDGNLNTGSGDSIGGAGHWDTFIARFNSAGVLR